MKSTLLILVMLLAVGNRVWGAQANGLLIYTDHPSTYVESCEFTSLDSTKPAYYTIARTDGERLQIRPGGLWVVVDYPPSNSNEDITGVADSNLATIQALLVKYPQFKTRLFAAQSKWKSALELVHRMSFKSEVNTRKITLNYEGSQYDGVRLTSLDGEQVGITHSAGVTRLALEKLTKEQIMALNTTSTSVHIDPAWKEHQRIAPEADAGTGIHTQPKPTTTDNTENFNHNAASSDAMPVGPVIKKLQLGMRAKDAIKTVNVMENGCLLCGPVIDDVDKVYFGSGGDKSAAKLCYIYLKSNESSMVGLIAFNKEGLLTDVDLAALGTQTIFKSSNLSAQDFVQLFINNYGIPEMKAHGNGWGYSNAEEGWGISLTPVAGACAIRLYTIAKPNFD